MQPIRFLSIEDVIQIQQDTVEHEGGGRGLRDLGCLIAAVMMPRQTFGGQVLHEDLAAMSAAYLFHIAQNRPFVDANTRAATLASLVFLAGNGVQSLPDPDELEQITMAVASGQMPKPDLIAWFNRVLAWSGAASHPKREHRPRSALRSP